MCVRACPQIKLFQNPNPVYKVTPPHPLNPNFVAWPSPQRLPLQQHHHRVGDASGQPWPHRGPGGALVERPAALARLPVQHATETHHAALVS